MRPFPGNVVLPRLTQLTLGNTAHPRQRGAASFGITATRFPTRYDGQLTIRPMIVHPIAEPILDAEERFEGFENLMPFRVQNILLVSSLYDSFILREDGRLSELLIEVVANGGSVGFMPLRIWPRARMMLPSRGLAL